jgi:hypothetical protein
VHFPFIHFRHSQHPLVPINCILHLETLRLELNLQDGVVNRSIFKNEVKTIWRLNFVQEDTRFPVLVKDFLRLILHESLEHLLVVMSLVVIVPSCRFNSQVNNRRFLAVIALEEVVEFLSGPQMQLLLHVSVLLNVLVFECEVALEILILI